MKDWSCHVFGTGPSAEPRISLVEEIPHWDHLSSPCSHSGNQILDRGKFSAPPLNSSAASALPPHSGASPLELGAALACLGAKTRWRGRNLTATWSDYSLNASDVPTTGAVPFASRSKSFGRGSKSPASGAKFQQVGTSLLHRVGTFPRRGARFPTDLATFIRLGAFASMPPSVASPSQLLPRMASDDMRTKTDWPRTTDKARPANDHLQL